MPVCIPSSWPCAVTSAWNRSPAQRVTRNRKASWREVCGTSNVMPWLVAAKNLPRGRIISVLLRSGATRWPIVRLHAATKERPIDRFQEERPYLRPLPAIPFDTDEILPVVVTPHARVHYDGNRYSVPPALVRKPVTLRANATRSADSRPGPGSRAAHALLREGPVGRPCPGPPGGLETASASPGWPVRGTNSTPWGPLAREFHLKLLSMPVKPTVHLRRLLGLVRLYGRKEVLAAIGQALQFQTYDAAYVEALLLQERRRRELPSPTPLQPKRRELIEDIHLEEPDPARYDRLCGDSDPEHRNPQHDIPTPREAARRSGGAEAPPHRRTVSGSAQRGRPQAEFHAGRVGRPDRRRSRCPPAASLGAAAPATPACPSARRSKSTTSTSPSGSPSRPSCGCSTATSWPSTAAPSLLGPRERESRISWRRWATPLARKASRFASPASWT